MEWLCIRVSDERSNHDLSLKVRLGTGALNGRQDQEDGGRNLRVVQDLGREQRRVVRVHHQGEVQLEGTGVPGFGVEHREHVHLGEGEQQPKHGGVPPQHLDLMTLYGSSDDSE